MKKQGISKKTAIAEIVQSFRRIFKSIQEYSEEVLKEFGVTGPQLWLLKILHSEDGTPVSELSQKMFLHISTVSSIINRLEEKGYIERKRTKSDRRLVLIHLTEKGLKIMAKAPEPAQGKLLHGLQNLSQKEVLGLYESLQKIVQLMEVNRLKVKFFFSEE
ncbi:MAG: MarR family winged helix-turn-helix transcriptional regulator [Nitrospiria bacterium]